MRALFVAICMIICSLSEVFEGRGGRSEISNFEPPIMRECWLVMQRGEMISFSGASCREECPNMSPTILWDVGVEVFCKKILNGKEGGRVESSESRN